MKQFTEKQRYELNAYLQVGKSKEEIAALLGFYRSTIYREICRLNLYFRQNVLNYAVKTLCLYCIIIVGLWIL